MTKPDRKSAVRKLRRTEPSQKTIGRPSKFSDKLADAICERLSRGNSLNAICQDDGFPNISTVIRWLADERYAAFRTNYERARETQADAFVDEIVDIADTEPDPNVARVRIDARKWVAGKMRPKKYGEKVTQEVSGPDGGPIKAELDAERFARTIAGIAARSGSPEGD